jgi:ribose transport system permease protein
MDRPRILPAISRTELLNIVGPLVGLLLVTLLFWGVDTWRASQQGYVATFASTESAQVVLKNTSLVGVAALGMTLVIIAGGIDLSVAAAIALSATVAAWSFRAGHAPLVSVSLGVLTGVTTGFVNGGLVSWLKVVPFIITLGTMTIFRGVGRVISNETPIRTDLMVRAFRPEDDAAASGLPWEQWILSLMEPYPDPEWLLFSPGVWLMFAMAILLAAVLHLSVFGRHVYALGSNEDTARLCGISVTWTRIAVYTLAGLFVGVAGIYNFSTLSGEGDPNSLPGRELDVIAAVVIGGGSLNGGRGSVLGTLCGACLMEVIRHGCVVLGVPAPYQQIIIGLIVIVAVTVDQLRQRRLAQ